jgi:hypothetical protein
VRQSRSCWDVGRGVTTYHARGFARHDSTARGNPTKEDTTNLYNKEAKRDVNLGMNLPAS